MKEVKCLYTDRKGIMIRLNGILISCKHVEVSRSNSKKIEIEGITSQPVKRGRWKKKSKRVTAIHSKESKKDEEKELCISVVKLKLDTRRKGLI